MPASTYLANKENDHFLGKAAFTSPMDSGGTAYVALCTTEPVVGDDGGSITETAYTGYARAPTTSAHWGSSAARSSTNSAGIIEFPEMTGGASGNITHFAILDGNAGTSADKLLAWGPVDSSPVTISSGETPRFNTSGMTLNRA